MKEGKSRFTSLFISLIFATFILTSGLASGDDDGKIDYYSRENMLKFADHLYQEGDYLRAAGEYQRYLFYFPQDADSTLYKIGLCYLRSGKIRKAISFFDRLGLKYPESRFRFAASYQIAHSYFLLDRYEDSVQYINRVLDESKEADQRGQLQILVAFNRLYQRRWRDAEAILESLSSEDGNLSHVASLLRSRAREGAELQHKNPMLAGLFSAIIPGAGKMYCKQYGDGLYSFILVGTTGLLAWDGFRENGFRSVKGWLFGSMSGVFYAGNVYGSSIAARIYNRQLEADLLSRLPDVPHVDDQLFPQ